MAKREKKKVITGVTQSEAEYAMSVYAELDAREEKINAGMNIEFTKIRDKNAHALATIASDKEEAFEIIQAYANENRDTLFSKKKSVDTPHGVFGYRTGTPKLKLMKGFTWPAVTNLLKEFLPGHVRIVTEPAKDKLLADRNDEHVYPLFEKCGIDVVQDEVFFIELKKEEVN